MCDPRLLQWSTDHLPPDPPRRVSEFAMVILGTWMVLAVSLIAAGFTEDWSPAGALRALPSWMEFALGVMILAGSSMVLAAVIPQHKMASERWALESSGFILTAVGWFAFSLAAFVMAPASAAHWIYGLGFSLASITRVVRVLNVATHTRGVKLYLDVREDQ